jgi:hypothetical protein
LKECDLKRIINQTTWIKSHDFFDLQNSPSYGGDLYRSYKYYVREFKNKVGQGETMHSAQLGIQLSRMIGKLLEHDQSAERDLIELFTMIDSSCSINLRKMTDSYV